MDCSSFRDAISARLDGEEAGLRDEAVDAHLAHCADCRGWAAAAGALDLVVSRAPRPDVRLDPALLAALVGPPEGARGACSRPASGASCSGSSPPPWSWWSGPAPS